MNRATLLLGAALIASLSACQDPPYDANSQLGPNPSLPEPKNFLFPAMGISPGVGWKQGELPKVAPGLVVKALATGLNHPRFVYALPNGDVLAVQGDGPGTEPVLKPKQFAFKIIRKGASSAPGGGKPLSRITLIRDANGDGTPEMTSVLLDHLSSPFGVAWIDNLLYVANTDGVMVYPMPLGTTTITAPGKLLTPLPGGPIDHHWTKGLVLSPDGQRLYATVGSNSNIVENGFEAEKGRAAVWEIDRATGRSRLFAGGLRNPNSPVFYPGTNDLYVVVNERDELGSNLVPDYMTRVQDGGFYGWPYSYWGKHVDERVPPMDRRPNMVAKAIMPDYALGSHVAALGLAFNTGNLFPQYQGGAFVGEHGSWDRYSPSGYKVVYIPFVSGRPSGKPVDVVSGFLTPDNKNTFGRPVGVAIDRTGALLVADDVGNAVWRVTPAAMPVAKPTP
jgi:glucose/arabinose dehydrogenase